MLKYFKNRLLVSTLFLFASEIFINYTVKITPSLHFSKDDGMASIALFHCINSYIYFILLKINIFSICGIGFCIGILTCIAIITLSNVINLNYFKDWFSEMLLWQFIASFIVFLFGAVYVKLCKSSEKI